jgi:predicted DsbA family dithiol-disulfide isomerase
LADVTVQKEWLPFLLNENTPEEGEDMMEHLTAKYGKQMVEKFSAPNNPLDVAGAKVGVKFNKARRVIPTMRAHQLMEYANKSHPDKSNALMDLLFSKYFEQAVDVSKVDQLLAIATEVGLDPTEAREAIESPALKDEVMKQIHYARRQLRVSGVPYVIIQREGGKPISFSGAQPPDIIAEQLLEAMEYDTEG